MTKFGNEESGSILNGSFFCSAAAAELRCLLPLDLRPAERADKVNRFMFDVANAAQIAHADRRAETARDVLRSIADLGSAAKKLKQATQPLSGNSECFDVLAGHFDYFRLKQLPKDTPGMAELLSRIYADLSALQDGCRYATGKIKPDRSVQSNKFPARLMANQIAQAFKNEFGYKPPEASWFLIFMRRAGKLAKITCGSDVVKHAVQAVDD